MNIYWVFIWCFCLMNFSWKRPYHATNRPVTNDDRKTFADNLSAPNKLQAFVWFTVPESRDAGERPLLLPIIQKIMDGDSFKKTQPQDQVCYLCSNLELSSAQIPVQQATAGQSDNPHCMAPCKGRVTASNLGPVLKALARGWVPANHWWIPQLEVMIYFIRHPFVQWGKINESMAIRDHGKRCDVCTMPTGVWLNTAGFMGGSQVGIVGEDKIVERKRPIQRLYSLSCKSGRRERFLLERVIRCTASWRERHHRPRTLLPNAARLNC